MQRLAHFFSGGTSARSLAINESSDRWRERSGRLSGPLTYVPGDVCDATFRTATAQSHRERDDAYGGPALLVGIVEARGIVRHAALAAATATAAAAAANTHGAGAPAGATAKALQ